jgi:hypothetical protein
LVHPGSLPTVSGSYEYDEDEDDAYEDDDDDDDSDAVQELPLTDAAGPSAEEEDDDASAAASSEPSDDLAPDVMVHTAYVCILWVCVYNAVSAMGWRRSS